MRHISAVPLIIAALAGLPGEGAAQHALKDHRFWAVPRVNAQRSSVWQLPGVASASPIRPNVGLTVLSTPRPTLPHLSWSQTDLTLATAFTVALLVDAGQTRWLAKGGWHAFRETNPILGSRPTVGQARSGVRRPAGTPPGRGTGARGARRQPDRSHVHRGLERQLAVRGAAPLWLREPAHGSGARRRPRADGLLHQRRRAVRAARQQ